jgi:hypothetical protein
LLFWVNGTADRPAGVWEMTVPSKRTVERLQAEDQASAEQAEPTEGHWAVRDSADLGTYDLDEWLEQIGDQGRAEEEEEEEEDRDRQTALFGYKGSLTAKVPIPSTLYISHRLQRKP